MTGMLRVVILPVVLALLPSTTMVVDFEQIDVYASGRDGYHTYGIPSIVVTNNGTLLAFGEGRKTSHSDHGDVDLMLKRSAVSGFGWPGSRLNG